MRTVLAVLFMVGYFLVSIPILALESLRSKKHKEQVDRHRMHSIKRGFYRVGKIAGVRLAVKGRERIPTDEPVLYVGNHRGFFDIVTAYPLLIGLTGFIAKKGIGKVPVMGWMMKRGYCLLLDQDDPRESVKTIQQAISYVKSGVSVFIYPEGGRNRDDLPETSLLPFKDGSFKIASRTNCPVVPVATIGTRDVLERHFPWIKSADVTVIFGEPVRIGDLTKEEQKAPGAYFENLVRQLIADELSLRA